MTKELAPIIKTLQIPLPADRAFELFTTHIGKWWPLESHSVSQSADATCEIEPRVGGRILERDPGGNEHVWGTLNEWDPPSAVAFSWHPGRHPNSAQHVSVRFTATPQGSEMKLVHSGWESYGENADSAHRNYQTGWDHVLGAWLELANE